MGRDSTPMPTDKIVEFERLIGYHFTDRKLAQKALTHTSYANEKLEDKAFNNERLEFLGDAVLELVTSQMLYATYDLPEGELSKRRASIVCEASLAYVAKEMEFGQFLYLSNGEEQNGGRERNSLLADMVEAVIGAVYLEAGLEEAGRLIESLLFSRLQEIESHTGEDYKTELQELVQARENGKLEYELVQESGPDHDKTFSISLRYMGEVVGQGTGKTKKEAEQKAAQKALALLREKE